MPCNVLLIQNEDNSIATGVFLNNTLTIPHVVKNSLDKVNEFPSTKNFSHLIFNKVVDKSELKQFVNIPILIVAENKIDNTEYKLVNSPLNFEKIFSFISNTSNFSLNTLKEYALGEEEILIELKNQILEEFTASYNQLPKLIDNKNLTEIKSTVHQISSKFSLLEMEKAYQLAKNIDNNILNNEEVELNNCKKLVIDIAIVLDQLKN
ncbi:MAG TPA: hypothetical protein VJ970_02305 [Flavobacteriaceae bacterium]|nr:hypothetical protein [Flavobacteriaceae bacterium]